MGIMNDIINKELQVANEILKIKGSFTFNELRDYLISKKVITNDSRDFHLLANLVDEDLNTLLEYNEFRVGMPYCLQVKDNANINRVVSSMDMKKFQDQDEFTAFEFIYLLKECMMFEKISKTEENSLKDFIILCKKNGKYNKLLKAFDSNDLSKLDTAIENAILDGYFDKYTDHFANRKVLNVTEQKNQFDYSYINEEYFEQISEFSVNYFKYIKTGQVPIDIEFKEEYLRNNINVKRHNYNKNRIKK